MGGKLCTNILGNGELSQLLASVDVKPKIGAIVEIEFMVQYLVVGWARDH